MSQFAAALAGAITAVGVGATAMGRSWPGAGQRAARRAPFALAAQEFRLCLKCGVETAATIHSGGAFTCTEGHLTVPGGA